MSGLSGPASPIGRGGSTGAGSSTTNVFSQQRPQLKSRAYSVPLSAHTSHFTDASASSDEDSSVVHRLGNGFSLPEEVDDDFNNELDIAADPFFQQCNFLSSAIVTGGQEDVNLGRGQVQRGESYHSGQALPPNLHSLRPPAYSSMPAHHPDASHCPVQPTGNSVPTGKNLLQLNLTWAGESSDSLSSVDHLDGIGTPKMPPSDRKTTSAQSAVYNALRPDSSEGRLSPKSHPGILHPDRPDSRTDPNANPICSHIAFPEQSHSSKDINIVVMGEKGVGKSTFIQRAFGLRNFASTALTTSKVTIDGETSTVCLLELSMTSYEIDSHDRIIWPNSLNGSPMPPIHGAFVLYDVMSKASLEEVPDLLISLHKSGIPFMIVSSKCDCHPALREVDPEVIKTRAQDLLKAEVPTSKTSISSLGAHKKSLEFLVREILLSRQGLYNIAFREIDPLSFSPHLTVSSRRRANSTASNLAPIVTAAMKHARANSDCSGPLFRERGGTPSTPSGQASILLKEQSFLNLEDSPGRESIYSGIQQPENIGPIIGLEIFNVPPVQLATSSEGVGPDMQGTVLVPVQAGFRTNLPSTPTFDQLVDHLLDIPLGRGDEKFRCVFLCLYRFFAAPYTLLDAILSRFEGVEMKDVSPLGILDSPSSQLLLRGISQQRYISVLQTWVSKFPGDFAHPQTRQRLADFLLQISDPTTEVGCFHMVSAQMMMADLDTIAEDDDTEWLCSDRQLQYLKASDNTTALVEKASALLEHTSFHDPRKQSVASGAATPAETLSYQMSSVSLSSTDSSSFSRIASSQTTNLTPEARKQTTFGSVSRKPSMAVSQLSQESKSTSQSQIPASFTLPLAVPRFDFSKIHWTAFMSAPEELLAQEFTAVDWQFFSYIRPRDIIRHVTMSDRDKEIVRCLRLALTTASEGSNTFPTNMVHHSAWLTHQGMLAVDLLANHFNRIANLTANIVLMRDKVRHRVAALSKMMRIARNLRILNNYHSLGAVLAGLNSTPVHRLSHTRDLVSRDVARDFMKLEILMSSSRSYSAYRLAWENTEKERIPYLPLHRRDVVAAIEGSKTWLDEMYSSKGSADLKGQTAETSESGFTSAVNPTSPSVLSKEESGWVPGVPGKRCINWRKFEIIGEIMLTLGAAQEIPYPDISEPSPAAIARGEEIRSIIMESKLIINEEDLYQRSCVLEPSGSQMTSTGGGSGSGGGGSSSHSGLGGLNLGLGGLGFGSMNSTSSAPSAAPGGAASGGSGGGAAGPGVFGSIAGSSGGVMSPSLGQMGTPDGNNTVSSTKKFHWFSRGVNRPDA